MKEHRCPRCNRLLFKAIDIANATLEVVCPRCKAKNKFVLGRG